MGVKTVYLRKKSGNSESDLINLLQQRNEKAFSILYTQYSPALFIRIKSNVGCMVASEDILQDVFLKIWLNINNYKSERGSLFTWMVTIAKNESIDFLRSKEGRNRNFTVSINKFDIKVETSIEQRLDSLNVLKSLSSLPLQEKTILNMYSIGYTCKEVSNLLSLPEGTVKTKMRWSYKKLRQMLA